MRRAYGFTVFTSNEDNVVLASHLNVTVEARIDFCYHSVLVLTLR